MVAALGPMMLPLLGALLGTLCREPTMTCDNLQGLRIFWSHLLPETQRDLGRVMLSMEPYVAKCSSTLFSECRDTCKRPVYKDLRMKDVCEPIGCKFYQNSCMMLKNLVAVARNPPSPQTPPPNGSPPPTRPPPPTAAPVAP